MHPSRYRVIAFALLVAASLSSSNPLLAQQKSRIEIVVERNDGQSWRAIDPRLVLNREDRVRFRVKSSFEGYLYVTYLSTSGKYDALFPGRAGEQNKVLAGKEFQVCNPVAGFLGCGFHTVSVVYQSPTTLVLRSNYYIDPIWKTVDLAKKDTRSMECLRILLVSDWRNS